MDLVRVLSAAGFPEARQWPEEPDRTSIAATVEAAKQDTASQLDGKAEEPLSST